MSLMMQATPALKIQIGSDYRDSGDPENEVVMIQRETPTSADWTCYY